MALPRWARPYRKTPRHLTAQEWKQRQRVFTPLWYLFCIPLYASVGLLALTNPGLVIGLVSWSQNWSRMSLDAQMLVIIPIIYFVVMGTISYSLKWFFLHE